MHPLMAAVLLIMSRPDPFNTNDATVSVEKEIRSYNQQLEALNRRPEGLRPAAELLESEQFAIVELLETGTAIRGGIPLQLSIPPVAYLQKGATSSKRTTARKALGRNTLARIIRTKAAPSARAASHDASPSCVEMIATVLRRHPRRTVRELIALLDKEYHWKTTESANRPSLYAPRQVLSY
jgi:hypothetical protein